MPASHALKQTTENEQPRITNRCGISKRMQKLSELQKWNIDPASKELLDELLSIAAEAERKVAEQNQRIRYLESLSVTDELTGLLNRRGFEAEFNRAMARADRAGEHGLLVLFDLDHFKAVNDTYGHLAGDAVLSAIGEKLASNTRQCDAVARIGGDEFAVLFTQADPDTASGLASKLDKMLNTLIVTWNGHQIPVSASLGFDGYGPGKTTDTVMFLADRALYGRKNKFREMVAAPCKPNRVSRAGVKAASKAAQS